MEVILQLLAHGAAHHVILGSLACDVHLLKILDLKKASDLAWANYTKLRSGTCGEQGDN